MQPPRCLPDRLFLLCYDPARRRIHGGINQGLLIRAGILEELRLAEAVVDDDGKVGPGPRRQLDDAVLAATLAEITASTRPRSWTHWIAANTRASERAVLDRLEDGLYVLVHRYRALGLFPSTQVTPRDTPAVEALRALVDRILAGSDDVPARDAALVALAAAAELGTILPRQRRRQYRPRIERLAGGPVPPALARVVRQQAAARASAASV
jgi:hypothetical protein